MRKIILLIAIIASVCSCERYCPFCDDHGDCDHCGNKPTLTYKSDSFYADKLIGTWQCSYNTVVGKMNLKTIEFIDSRRCDITYSEYQEVDWYTETFIYSYSGQYLKFSRNGVTFSFHIKDYIFPELYVEDSFGKYTWKKIKTK